jgi:thiamine biosynthesis protein ThiI
VSAQAAEPLLVGRYAEIALKGANRADFERALARSARRSLPAGSTVEVRGSRLLVRLPAGTPAEAGAAALQRCFGLVSIRTAWRLPRSAGIDEVAALAAAVGERARQAGARTFKIAASRADKTFPLTSPELNRQVGGRVAKATGLAVDVHRPDVELGVEVRPEGIYVWGTTVPGPGGLPTGTAGRAMVLLSGGIDSPVAAYLAAKRGLRLSAVYFHTFPYTGDGARQKVVDLARVLARYVGDVRLWIGHFTDLQLAVQERVPEPLRTVVVRRLMLRFAEVLARRDRAGALVTGDSLGQVASQTLESMAAIGEVATLPLLRPLVAADKTEIVDLARRVGTYEISIRPFDDCCTLFAPRHPKTRPTRAEAREAEARLPVEELLAAAVARSERLRVTEEGAVPDPPGGSGAG